MAQREMIDGEFAMRDAPLGTQVKMTHTWRRTRAGGEYQKPVFYEKFADGWHLNVGKNKWVIGRHSDAEVAYQLGRARSERRA